MVQVPVVVIVQVPATFNWPLVPAIVALVTVPLALLDERTVHVPFPPLML